MNAPVFSRTLTLGGALISCVSLAACGAPEGSTTGTGTTPTGGQTVTSTQPGGDCEKASSSLLAQIEDQLASSDTKLTYAQVVQSDEPIDGGPEAPFFVSASASVGNGAPQVATWVLEDEQDGTVVPADAFAKVLSDEQDPADLQAYRRIGQVEAFQASRKCTNEAIALRIKQQKQEEAAQRQEKAAAEQKKAATEKQKTATEQQGAAQQPSQGQ